MADLADAPLNLDQAAAAAAGLGGGAEAGAAAGAGAAGAAGGVPVAARPARGPSSILSGKRLLMYGTVSTAAAAFVTFNAFRQRSNYYAAAVWLGRSNGSMLILLNFGIFAALMYALAVQFIFFGQLRPMEVEHLHERAWYALTESLLAMTIFRDEFDVKFVIMFGTLLFLKVFHWLTEDRVDYMEQTPSVPILFHLRMLGMLNIMAFVDAALVVWSLEAVYLDTKQLGLTIMFSTEFQILLATILSIGAKYIINCIDNFHQDVWETKSMYVFYVDLVTDFVKLLIYTWFFVFILTTYGFPFNLVRDVVFTARSFFGRVRDLLRYREATRNMNERYPNASIADVRALSDPTCIICRDEMLVAGAEGVPPGQPSVQETPKKLPCGHIFHFHCLRSWLERQQSCPTCRRNVLQNGTAGPAGAAAAAAAGPGAGAGAGPADAGAAANRPPPPQPGARPAPPAAPAATGTPVLPPTQSAGSAAAANGSAAEASRTTGPGVTRAPAGAGGPPEDWTVQGSLERLTRGLQAGPDSQRRTGTASSAQASTSAAASAADVRPTPTSSAATASNAAPSNSASASATSSTGSVRLRDKIMTDVDRDPGRIPLTLLELLFETSLGEARPVPELGTTAGDTAAEGEATAGSSSGANGTTAPTLILPLSHATGPNRRSAWLPPRPDQLPDLNAPAAPSDGASAASSSTATTNTTTTTTASARPDFVRSGAPSPSTASEPQSTANGGTETKGGESETKTEGKTGGAETEVAAPSATVDPEDPRRAVREATLRRFAAAPASAASQSTASSATPTAETTGPSSEEKGKAKAVESDTPASAQPQPTAALRRPLPGNPRLKPLFGTLSKPPAGPLPFPLETTPTNGSVSLSTALGSTNAGAGGAAAAVAAAAAPLSAQMLTDEALAERLRTLERLQGVIGDAMGELQRLLGSERVAGPTAAAEHAGPSSASEAAKTD